MINDLLHQPSTSSDVVIIPDAPVPDVVAVPDMRLSFDKTTQADLKKPHRSIRINCSIKSGTVDMGCQASFEDAPSPVAPAVNPSTVALSPAASFEPSFETESDTDLPDEDSDYVDEVDPGSDYEPEEDEDQEKKQMRACMVRAVMKDTLMCFGIPQKISYMIDFLAAKSKSPVIDVMITLKKIRQNESYAYLAMLFGMSTSNVARIFSKTLFSLASVVQNLIVWPDAQTIKSSLPIAFRARYANTQCIIDCFEIEIEKPSNSQHQALTWSEYKKANTLKYLVSCTPDGIVTFVSKGYGGRTTDAVVVEESGFLDHLLPSMDVMTDRGFKNISHLIEGRGCKIVCPPSVSAGEPMTVAEVKSSKRIGATRIHVERLIRRFREFHSCLPHACVDHNLVPIYDQVLIIVAGLINLQSNLIKT